VQPGPMALGKGHAGEHVLFGLVQQYRQFGNFGPGPIGDLTPLCPDGAGIIPGEGCG
jgi:hypothetical protein